ncbi:MAG TPA: glycosyltransferase family 4 protein, partial [Gemmatimonadales bacterium]|nr:glycosyltransferase family 4 protein [Gemmatimonadales bacterium]
MRILFWTGSFWPHIGGADVMATRLVVALRERGHQVLVVTGRSDPELPAEEGYHGIPVRRFDFWETLHSGSLEGFVAMRSAVGALKREFRSDIIHLAFLGPDVIFHLETARAYAAPTLVTVQQAGIHAWGNQPDTVLGRALRAADWAVYCSQAMRREMEGVIPELASRSSVIPNALDPPSEQPTPLPEEPRVLCMGRMVR